MDWTPKILEGELVRLEPLAPHHEDGLWQASRDARTWRWLSIVQPQTPEEMHDYVEGALASAGAGLELPFATIARDEERIVGSTRFLALRPEHRSIEIGWTWLAPEAWGTGINVEAKLLMLEHAFERLACRRVEFKTDARNDRSRGAMEALPAQFEGVHRQQMVVRGGENRDTAWYSILDVEWPEVRANLLRRLGREEELPDELDRPRRVPEDTVPDVREAVEGDELGR
jgi:RimJ/RimL family protein N-acetyltransferase